jgi:hypothetical protein
MALAAGNIVYSTAATFGGFMEEPPLFGIVDFVGAGNPDDTAVNWENGLQQTFSTTAALFLVEIGFDVGANDLIGRLFEADTVPLGRIIKSFFLDPDGSNERAVLGKVFPLNKYVKRSTDSQPLYVIFPFDDIVLLTDQFEL